MVRWLDDQITGVVILMDVDAEFGKYMKACYGNGPVTRMQLKEVKQAFLSGMVVILTARGELPGILELKTLLEENQSFPDVRRN